MSFHAIPFISLRFKDPTKPSPFGNVSGLSAVAREISRFISFEKRSRRREVSIFEGLKQYQAYNKLKRAVLQLLTRELSEFQIQELEKLLKASEKGFERSFEASLWPWTSRVTVFCRRRCATSHLR